MNQNAKNSVGWLIILFIASFAAEKLGAPDPVNIAIGLMIFFALLWLIFNLLLDGSDSKEGKTK